MGDLNLITGLQLLVVRRLFAVEEENARSGGDAQNVEHPRRGRTDGDIKDASPARERGFQPASQLHLNQHRHSIFDACSRSIQGRTSPGQQDIWRPPTEGWNRSWSRAHLWERSRTMHVAKETVAAVLAAVLMVALLLTVRSPAIAESRSEVVASSEVASGVEFRSLRWSAPNQRISLITVAPWARVRSILTTAGRKGAPFATVSSAVGRLNGLAGVNGYFTTLPGANPMLVLDGRIVAPPCGRQCVRDPRTGFGLTKDGSALFVTVDGRRADATGMGLRAFARLLRSLGAVWAVNLDGGGSTTMVVGGVVANTPVDSGGERLVRSALILLPSARGGVASFVRQLRHIDGRVILPLLPSRALRGFRLAA
jgi:Phosphodiester glycosidase